MSRQGRTEPGGGRENTDKERCLRIVAAALVLKITRGTHMQMYNEPHPQFN